MTFFYDAVSFFYFLFALLFIARVDHSVADNSSQADFVQGPSYIIHKEVHVTTTGCSGLYHLQSCQ